MWSLFTLFNQCFDPVIPHEDAHELQVHHPSFFFFSDGSNSSFQCWSYSFPRFKCFSTSVHLLIVHLSLFLSGVLKISQKNHVSFLNPFELLQVFLSFKLFNSTGAISLQNRSTVFSFEWALTHRSFPRILPDSSNSPGVILNSFQVWRKNGFHQSHAFSKIALKYFHRWFNLSNFHSGVSQQFMVVLIIFLNFWRPKKDFS